MNSIKNLYQFNIFIFDRNILFINYSNSDVFPRGPTWTKALSSRFKELQILKDDKYKNGNTEKMFTFYILLSLNFYFYLM